MKEYSETIPVQYQEGKASFLGMDILVDERVLIPRPETELLVEVSADLCRKDLSAEPFILDLCTGSGAVALALAKMMNNCRVIGSDVSPDAISVARENISRFDLEDRIELVISDMFGSFGPQYEGSFDCIVSNPPYVSDKDYVKLDAWVKVEPKLALYAGEKGMDHLSRLIFGSGKFLKPDGFVAVEVGYDQAEKVKYEFASRGFKKVTGFRDFNGYERVIVGWKNG
ncbi:MAG: peptide chain release factor N(5)-glutamine methyltransferase [Candidatus Omnitrophota bacterium]